MAKLNKLQVLDTIICTDMFPVYYNCPYNSKIKFYEMKLAISIVISLLFSMSGCTTSTKTAPDSNVISVVIEDNNRYLFSIENNRFEKIAKFRVGHETSIRGLTISDRYIVIMHRKLNMPSSPQISTPESRAFLRNAPAPPPPDHYYTVNDLQTGKSITSYQGFVDDILYSGDIIKIRFFIDGGGKFYYVKEGEWSDEHKAELNPTLFIGTFK